MQLPKKIKEIVKDKPYIIDIIGLSKASVIIYDDYVLKIRSLSEESINEYLMMKAIQKQIKVPKVICFVQTKKKTYLLMEKLTGLPVSSEEVLKDPTCVVNVLCEALKQMWSINLNQLEKDYNSKIPTFDDYLEKIKIKVNNEYEKTNSDYLNNIKTYGFNSFHELVDWLIKNKPCIKEFTLSHGDFCLPNIFVKDKYFNGLIDLGNASISCKYQDLAICYRSLRDNYNGTYGQKIYDFDPNLLFKALNITPDWELIKYFLLLDEI